MNKKIYLEWLWPVSDYSEALNKNERKFEIVIPAVGSIAAVLLCFALEITDKSIAKLNDLLPNVIAILIGFTISTIAIIVSTSDETDRKINRKLNRIVNNEQITFKQWFLINLVYYTFSEILFVILTFVLPLINFIIKGPIISCAILLIYCYLFLRNMFGVVKTLTKLYMVLYRDNID